MSSKKTTPRLNTSEEGVITPVSWYSGSMYLSRYSQANREMHGKAVLGTVNNKNRDSGTVMHGNGIII